MGDEYGYEKERREMIRVQLRGKGISDERVLKVMEEVPRHKFVLKEYESMAYQDTPLPIGEGQTISQPYIVALMTESLDLRGEEKVLEIGTGSGYQSAILAELAKEVYSLERFENLKMNAEAALKELGYTNIKLRSGDGTLGWPEQAPFDSIIITAASRVVPSPLIEQLREGGKLILPLGGSLSQVLTLFEKKKDSFEPRQICDCVFVPLVGRYA